MSSRRHRVGKWLDETGDFVHYNSCRLLVFRAIRFLRVLGTAQKLLPLKFYRQMCFFLFVAVAKTDVGTFLNPLISR